MDETICNICKGVQNDGTKKYAQSSFFVSHNSPNNPANQQADHLNAYNEFTAIPDLGSIEAQGTEAFDADDPE